MKKAMIRVDWNKSQIENDINPVLRKNENICDPQDLEI